MRLDIYELEPERYELTAAPLYRFTMERRAFLQALGGGLLIVSYLKGQRDVPKDVASWLHIGTNGKVTAFTGKAEVGQNIRTSLSQAVAEELGVPASSVELVMADTARVPYDMGTFGSMSTPRMAPELRRAAAAAKSLLPTTTGAAIHPPKGESVKKVDGRDFVTGKHKYVSDMKLPGMQYGRILRPDRYGATIASFDEAQAKSNPGVTVVRAGNFAGVVAPTAAEATAAAKAVQIAWKPAGPYTSAATLYKDIRSGGPAPKREIDDALAKSARKNEQTYTVAYIAHVPLEPRAAVAQWEDGKLNVWTGTQVPFGVRDELAEAFGLKKEDVRVQVPDTGSGYGGKHSGEAALEAAKLAQAAGKPVKLVWTREEEFAFAYFRPAGVIEVRSGIDADGRLTAWDFHNFNSGNSAIQTLYDVPVKRTEFHRVDAPLRQGSYRGLAATANHFAREVHMDEIAVLAKMDPLEFRLKNTSDPRLKAVLEAAAGKFGWKPGKSGIGIAGGFEKGGYVACCAEFAGGRVVRLVEAFECGAIVNPDHLKMQVEGGMVMGLGGALFESVNFADGQLKNGRLSQYRVPRFKDIPQIEVVLLDRKDLPSAGAGETPIVGVAPAIANAMYSATGERKRALPLK